MYIIITGLLLGYLIGSINPAIILSKIKGTDIRKMGSGNAGATNTLRNFGKVSALIVTLCDVAKSIIAILLSVLVARLLNFDFALHTKIAAAVGCILGHNFPVYFSFKGGKGVLVSAAALFMMDYRVGLIALLCFIIVFELSKYVSLGSLLSSCAAVIAAAFLCEMPIFLFVAFAGTLSVIRHKTNIKRLLKGTESKTTFSKK